MLFRSNHVGLGTLQCRSVEESKFPNSISIPSRSKLINSFSPTCLLSISVVRRGVSPWFADFANFVVGGAIPPNLSYQARKQFLHDARQYFWMIHISTRKGVIKSIDGVCQVKRLRA